jgi:hypothetical protein
MDDLEIEHEDIVMKCLMQTLKGDARTWYKALPQASIDGWDSFQTKFIEKWVDKQDNSFLLNAISNIKRIKTKLFPSLILTFENIS